uniref:Rho GTPase-activating protein 190 n=1 Tax=Steinernema glaseri TaxID=37863 RepID=A0A1I7YUS3_9BILA
MIGRSAGLNDGTRPEASTPTPPHAISDHRNVPTVAVIGLSGPDSIKGAAGVGKSLLCNRFVRPNYGDFYEDHISTLSQTDFGGSPVINSDHWLYWGEGELENGTEDLMHGKTTHVRVIEQTEFLDDETFDTISSGSPPPYAKRATKTKLESRDKLMYICKEQLGLETDFDQRVLPEGKTNIDAFIVVFDVSPVPHRSYDQQIDVVVPILSNALKSKKPVLIAATKSDRTDGNGLKALQRLLQKKEFKALNIPVIEVSALTNVNVIELLSLVAHTVEKCRCRPKILPYAEAVKHHNERRIAIRRCYANLLRELMPLNEWPTKRATWKQLKTRYNLGHHPHFDHFVATFGVQAAQLVYQQYVDEAREHWMQAKLQSHLPRLQHVFAQLIGMERVCDLDWSQAAALIKAHPLYDEYFQPLGNLADAQRSFYNYQKAVEREFRRERQEDDFVRLLTDCSQVTPGCPLSDVQLFLQGSPAFDCLQFNHAQLVYDRYQADLIRKAELDFTELLLEHIHLFMGVVLARRSGGAHNRPLLGLEEDEMAMIRLVLQEDLRYRQLSRLFELRDKMISEYACFISYPLVQNCHAQARCADAVVHEAFPSQFHRRKSCDKSSVICLELVIVGRELIASEFVNALRRMETINGAIECEYGHVQIRCRVVDCESVPKASELSQSVVILIDSTTTAEAARKFLATAKILFPPIFLPLCDPSHFDLLPSLHLQVNQLAESFGGIFLASSRDFDELDGSLQNSSDELSPMFRRDYVARVLSSVCCSQLDNRRVDLRVQFSLMCGDLYPLGSLLSGIFTKCSPAIQSSASAGFATIDVALSNPKRPVRVSLRVCAYHSWLLNKQIQPIHGHVLVYSARRRASLAHAAAAAQSLVAAAAPGTQQAIGQSILIIAVADVTDFFNDEASHLPVKSSELASRIGAVFVTISPEGTDHGHSVAYMEFFERIYSIQQHLEHMSEARLEKQLSEAALSVDHECDVPSDVCSENGNQAASVIPSDCASTTSKESVGSSRSLQARRLAVPESGFVSPFGNWAKDDSMALATTMSADRSRAETNQSRQSNGSTSAASSSNSNMAPLATPEPVEICSEYMCVKDALPNGAEPIYATVKNFETFRSNSVTANPTSRPSKINKKISRIRGNSDKRGLSTFSSDLTTLSADLAQCSVPSSGPPGSVYSGQKNGRSPPPPLPPKPQIRSTGELARLQPIVENQLRRSNRLHSMSAESLLSITKPDWSVSPVASDVPLRLLGRNTKKVAPADGGGIIRRVASSFRFKKFQPVISGPKEVSINEQSLIVRKDSGGGWKAKVPSSPVMGVRSVPHSPQIDRANAPPPPKPPSSNDKGVFSWLPSRSPKRNVRACSLEVERKGPSSIFAPTDTLQGLALLAPDGIPVFVTKCITFIEQQGGLELEGLYRVPGNQAQVLQLEKAFQANANISLADLDLPVHAGATALKNFFLNLPSPVIPYEIQEELITDANLEENREFEIRRFRRIAFDKMPKANRTLLHYFTSHINRVAACSSKNSMDMRNLAKVWWPTLFRPEFDSFEKLSGAITRLESATQFLFSHSEAILS